FYPAQQRASGAGTLPTMVVFSHVRWDGVNTRPKHVLGHMARHYRIVYLEEPVAGSTADHMEVRHPAPNVTVYRQHTTSAGHDAWAALESFVTGLAGEIGHPVAWFYTPMALPLLESLEPELVVYDCMTDAAGAASPRFMQREAALLAAAD
ncbi:hypothetical protein KZA17_28255, partial [Pseudomonas syringae]|nr:hypothetical protein [Pseudomonas syringae]